MIKACLVQIRPRPPAAGAEHLHGGQDALLLPRPARGSLGTRGAAGAGPASGQTPAEALQPPTAALPPWAAAGTVVVEALGQDVVIT